MVSFNNIITKCNEINTLYDLTYNGGDYIIEPTTFEFRDVLYDIRFYVHGDLYVMVDVDSQIMKLKFTRNDDLFIFTFKCDEAFICKLKSDHLDSLIMRKYINIDTAIKIGNDNLTIMYSSDTCGVSTQSITDDEFYKYDSVQLDKRISIIPGIAKIKNGFYLLCKTKNHLIIETTRDKSEMFINYSGQSALKVTLDVLMFYIMSS